MGLRADPGVTPAPNASIVSAAMTPVTMGATDPETGLAAVALAQALDDAKLSRSDVDGLVWNLGRPLGENYPALLDALGLDVRFVTQFWSHGRFTGTALVVAAMAVAAGQADVVACIGGAASRPAPTRGLARPSGDLVEDYGTEAVLYEAALAFSRYLAMFEVDRERVADVVLAQRAFATANPLALHRGVLTREDYAANPMVVEPLRELDCYTSEPLGWPPTNYGVCVIVTRQSTAVALTTTAVHLLAMQGVRGGRDERYWGLPGLGMFTQTASAALPDRWDRRVFVTSGVSSSEVDVLYVYDAFAPSVWMALERFGYCEPGQASTWATLDRIGPGGALPINTNGGILSEGHAGGWGHFVEMTAQLQGRAGPRQIPGASVAQWISLFGDSVMVTNDPARLRRERA